MQLLNLFLALGLIAAVSASPAAGPQDVGSSSVIPTGIDFAAIDAEIREQGSSHELAFRLHPSPLRQPVPDVKGQHLCCSNGGCCALDHPICCRNLSYCGVSIFACYGVDIPGTPGNPGWTPVPDNGGKL
ncbi:Protein of unknown function [Pyronema omphalodes CBS 100304]|uniref:Uncharacterized protein n=1 Tax=Pyronema omphalodes (strain CBS 100304) TaxID=1076935 RepID=U4L4A2_PYROM|nr:Protein of unknown function [Pyronema omphalodes CBS 100304]